MTSAMDFEGPDVMTNPATGLPEWAAPPTGCEIKGVLC